MKLIKCQVDRTKWYRGQGSGESALLRSNDGKMCCIGFLCKSLGMKRSDILDEAELATVKHDAARAFTNAYDDHVYGAYHLNDDPVLSDGERERAITELGKQMGVAFTFVTRKKRKPCTRRSAPK